MNLKKLLKGAKILCFLLNFVGASYIVSYNDDQNDCFVCEQYDRCETCYEDEGNDENYPSYQQINAYSGRYNPRRRDNAIRWRQNRYNERQMRRE